MKRRSAESASPPSPAPTDPVPDPIRADDYVAVLEGLLAEVLAGRGGLRVLEAGCGSMSHFGLAGAAEITGIDISGPQLERNSRLTTKIHGDLQAYPLPEDRFDLVVCWDVLEHLPRPLAALENMAGALAPDGLLVLKVPNAMSFKGWLAKLTPHGFHRHFYRRHLGQEVAPEQDLGPFPTPMRSSMRPAGLLAFARRRGLRPLLQVYAESRLQAGLRERHSLLRVAWPALRLAVAVLSLGAISLEDTEYLLVVRRPA